MINWSKGIDLPEGFVPETFFFLWKEESCSDGAVTKEILAKYGETELYLHCNITNPASLACMLKNGAVIHHQDEEKYYTRIKLEKKKKVIFV